MPWGAVAGAVIGAYASNKASKAQRGAASEANALSDAQYQQTRADNAGYRQRGENSANRLNYLMGQGAGDFTEAAPTMEGIRAGLQGQAARGKTNLSQGIKGIFSGRKNRKNRIAGENAQQAAMNAAADAAAPAAYEKALAEWNTRKATAAKEMADAKADPEYGKLNRDFTAQDRDEDALYAQEAPGMERSLARSEADLDQRTGFANSLARRFEKSDFEQDPGYQFRMDEGAKGVENSAAAKGNVLSGSALKGLTRYNQDFASNEYGKSVDRFNNDRSFSENALGNAFNRYGTDRSYRAGQGMDAFNRNNTNRTNTYNRLAAISGTGQIANQQNQAAGMNYANNASQNIIGAGNAQAAGYIGTANAISSGISSGYNYNQNNNMIDAYKERNKLMQPQA